MSDRALAEYVAVREIGLDQGQLLNAECARLVLVKWTAQSFEPRYDRLPRVLWELLW